MGFNWLELHCTALNLTVLCCTGQHDTELNCITLHSQIPVSFHTYMTIECIHPKCIFIYLTLAIVKPILWYFMVRLEFHSHKSLVVVIFWGIKIYKKPSHNENMSQRPQTPTFIISTSPPLPSNPKSPDYFSFESFNSSNPQTPIYQATHGALAHPVRTRPCMAQVV